MRSARSARVVTSCALLSEWPAHGCAIVIVLAEVVKVA